MSVFRLTFVLSVLLIVGGFFCPPIGIIDGPILTAVGELLMFGVIAQIPEAIKVGRNIKVQKGDSCVEIFTKESTE